MTPGLLAGSARTSGAVVTELGGDLARAREHV